MPRWFHEGLAVAVERPWDLEDRTRLASALLFGPRIGVTAIDELFLGDEGSQQRAYMLSAALVRHLVREQGSDAPARVLREARGRPFDVTRERDRPVAARVRRRVLAQSADLDHVGAAHRVVHRIGSASSASGPWRAAGGNSRQIRDGWAREEGLVAGASRRWDWRRRGIRS